MRRMILLGLTLSLLASCATSEVKAPAPAAPPPPPRTEQLLPELPVSQVEEEVTKLVPRKLFTLSVRSADIREVLLAFGKKTDLNIIFDPDVLGVVTVDLKRVTLEEALDALLSPINFVYRREGNFIRVSKPFMETRIFTVSYISTPRSGSASLSAAAGAAAGAAVGAAGVTGVIGGGGGATGASSSISSSDSVDLWADLEKTVVAFLSKEGKVVMNKNVGLVAVTDFPQNLRRVAQYLELVQGSAQRQVMIEAQILEVALSKEFSMGIDWSGISRNINLNPLGSIGLGTITGSLRGGNLVSQTLAPVASLFQVGLATKLGGQPIQLLLNALSKQGKVTVLSSPKISTVNNQKAVMKVATDDIFFNVTRRRETLTGGIITETVTETPQVVTEGIVLDVTPQIGEDDTVIMNIRPSISERVGQATSPTGITVPIIAVRAADTVVRAKDGQTVIIGGLMQNRSTRNVAGVPLLQDVPVMGGLFKRKEDEDKKTELVILLTPTVLIGRRHSELTPQELEILRETGRKPPS